ncbi:MAG: hypothetical protein JWM34_2602 [Ilumatobacteraceae bacterium]|nr:hypothetical protein [Ilumatobacteraceae bacterium]
MPDATDQAVTASAVDAFDESATRTFAWLCRIGGASRAVEVLPGVYASIVRGGAADERSLMAVGFRLLGVETSVEVRAVAELCIVRGLDHAAAAALLGRSAGEVAAALSQAVATFGSDAASVDSTLRRDEIWLDDVTRARCRTAIALDATEVTASASPRAGGRARLVLAGLVVVVLVVVAVVVIRHDDGSGPAALAGPPSLRWQHTIDGYLVSGLPDGDSVYTVEQRGHSLVAERLDMRTGSVRWSRSIDGADSGSHPQTGPSGVLAQIIDGSIAIVRSGLGDDQALLEMVSEADGSVRWTAETATNTVVLDPNGFVLNGPEGGATQVQAIDDAGHRLSAPLTVDAQATANGSLLVDDGVLVRLPAGSITPMLHFGFAHPKTVATMVSLRDGGVALTTVSPPTTTTSNGATVETAAGDDTTITRLDATGAVLWTLDPGLGSIGALQEMDGGRLFAQAQNTFIIIDLATGKAITVPRAYQHLQVVPGPDGRDVVLGFQGATSGNGGTGVAVIDVATDDQIEGGQGSFRTIAGIEGFIEPQITALADTSGNGAVLVRSTPPDDAPGVLLSRVDLRDGSTTWQMHLTPAVAVDVSGDDLLTASTGASSSTLSVYGP